MEVLTDDEGNVGILLDKEEATILKYLLQIDHKKGRDCVVANTIYSMQEAENVEAELWERLDEINLS